MTARDDFDRHLTAWLAADAPTREPEPLLDQVLARTARTQRRPAWLIPERWIPMSAISTQAVSAPGVPLRTIGAVALLIFALAVGALIFVGGQRRLPQPFGVAANGRIAYGDAGDLLIADSFTGQPRTIVAGPTTDVGPWFAPDGTRLSFLRLLDGSGTEPAELWVADPDGSDARRIGGPFESVSWYDWSPSGDTIAVASLVDGRSVITLVATDGSGATRLDLGGIAASTPSWRPSDGRQLLVRGVEAGVPGLYLVARDGSDPKKLELDPGDGAVIDQYFVSNPSWSPDGTRLAFQSPQTNRTSPQGPGIQVHVADIGPEGEVLADQTLRHTPEQSDFDAIFLPQGDRIVFTRSQSGVGSFQVSTLDVGRAIPVDLRCCSEAGFVSIAPDGTSLLVTSEAGAPMRRIELATGVVTTGSLTTDDVVTWQRLAP